MKFSKKKKKGLHIEVIPLIDIMTFLVATLVLVQLSMTKNQGMNVNLPAASASQNQSKKDDSVSITAMADGKYFWNKEQINAAQLDQKLQLFKAQNKDGAISINGDGKAAWEQVVQVLDRAKRAGFTKIGILTDK